MLLSLDTVATAATRPGQVLQGLIDCEIGEREKERERVIERERKRDRRESEGDRRERGRLR